MHKIVIDTNIFISALLGKSYPYKIVDELILERKVKAFTSPQILDEFESVLQYPKFRKYPQFITEGELLLTALNSFSTKIEPSISLSVLSDPSDNKFLEVAYSADADFLITGNRHFPFGKFQHTEILSPQKYWNTYWK